MTGTYYSAVLTSRGIIWGVTVLDFDLALKLTK